MILNYLDDETARAGSDLPVQDAARPHESDSILLHSVVGQEADRHGAGRGIRRYEPDAVSGRNCRAEWRGSVDVLPLQRRRTNATWASAPVQRRSAKAKTTRVVRWPALHIIVAERHSYSPLDFNAVDLSPNTSYRIGQASLRLRRKSLRLPGVKQPKGPRYFFDNARTFARIAKAKEALPDDDVVAILFETRRDGLRGVGFWDDKHRSMMHGFDEEGFTRGVADDPETEVGGVDDLCFESELPIRDVRHWRAGRATTILRIR